MKKKWLYGLIILIVLSMGFIVLRKKHHLNDLSYYVTQIKQRYQAKRNLQKNNIALPQPINYSASGLRGPFEDTTKVLPKSATEDIATNPLLAYPLSSLQFVGTVVENEVFIAYIVAPNNKIYQVKVGDQIGDKQGTIIDIQWNLLQIMEQNKKNGKAAEKFVTNLELKEKHS